MSNAVARYQKAFRRWSSARWIVALLFVFASRVECSLSAESAQEIADKSHDAMAPPFQYRIVTDGVESVVYQKQLSNDVLATRLETAKPSNVIRIVAGNESYEVYADKGLVIDTSFMQQMAGQQAAGLSQALGGTSAMGTLALRDTDEFNGKRCFNLVTAVPTDVLTMALKQLPAAAKDKFPVESRQYIDVESYVLMGMESYSSSGERLTQSFYSDIVRPVTLSNELFLPPSGARVVKPTSMTAYVATVLDVTRPPEAPRQPLGKLTIDPRTGLAIAPPPPGMTQEEFDRGVREAREKALIEMGTRPIRSTFWSGPRAVLVGGMLVVLAVVAGIIVWTKRH